MKASTIKALGSKAVAWTADKGDKRKDSGTSWKLISGLAVSAIVFFMIAYFSFRAWRTGRKLAKALHERDVAKEDLRSAETRKVRENLEEKIAEAEQDAKEAFLDAREAGRKVVRYEEELEIEREKINAIKNWKDIDRYLTFARLSVLEAFELSSSSKVDIAISQLMYFQFLRQDPDEAIVNVYNSMLKDAITRQASAVSAASLG